MAAGSGQIRLNPAVLIATQHKRMWLANITRKLLMQDVPPDVPVYIASDRRCEHHAHVIANEAGTWVQMMLASLAFLEQRHHNCVFLVLEDHPPNKAFPFSQVLDEVIQAFALDADQFLVPCMPIPEEWTIGRVGRFRDFSNYTSLMPAFWRSAALSSDLARFAAQGLSDPWSFEKFMGGRHLVADFVYPSTKDGVFNGGVIDVTAAKLLWKRLSWTMRAVFAAHAVAELPRKVRKTLGSRSALAT